MKYILQKKKKRVSVFLTKTRNTIFDYKHLIFTGAQPKAGTGHKMQTVSVVFSTLHC